VPAAEGASFPNMDFAAFARACGAQGFTARDPSAFVETVREFLATPGPAALHAVVDPDEIPAMPMSEWKKPRRIPSISCEGKLQATDSATKC
jgi:pyruvate dehydrogenase (quinone)